MDTALPQKFPFILDRNLAKPNCTENRVCTSCDTVVLGHSNSKIRCELEQQGLLGLVRSVSEFMAWGWEV